MYNVHAIFASSQWATKHVLTHCIINGVIRQTLSSQRNGPLWSQRNGAVLRPTEWGRYRANGIRLVTGQRNGAVTNSGQLIWAVINSGQRNEAVIRPTQWDRCFPSFALQLRSKAEKIGYITSYEININMLKLF